jgi:hypothetical protein
MMAVARVLLQAEQVRVLLHAVSMVTTYEAGGSRDRMLALCTCKSVLVALIVSAHIAQLARAGAGADDDDDSHALHVLMLHVGVAVVLHSGLLAQRMRVRAVTTGETRFLLHLLVAAGVRDLVHDGYVDLPRHWPWALLLAAAVADTAYYHLSTSLFSPASRMP